MKIIQNTDLDEAALAGLSRMEREWVYNALDCCVTLEVCEELLTQLDEVSSKTYEFSKALQGPILEMGIRGIRIDQRRRAEVLAEFKEKIAHVSANLSLIISEGIGLRNFNWRSPAQLKSLMYDVFGFKPIRKRNAQGQMAPSVNRDALEKLQQYYLAEPIVLHILALRDMDKKRSWLETEVDNDGRMRTSYNIAGTTTGRLSSSISDFGTGMNAQNIDRSLRSVFIPDPGMKFCNLDLEQGDSRNVGAICWHNFVEEFGEAFAGSYLDACESGDLHTTVSRLIWRDLDWTGDNAADKKVAEKIFYRQDSYRQMAKKGGHGCLSGDHEVLTPTGWISIKDKPAVIMQWEEKKSSFVAVSNWTEHKYTGTMHEFSGNSVAALMTHDHRVPYKSAVRGGSIHECPAEAGPQRFMPLGNGWVGGTKTVPAKLIAAHMADGHQELNWMCFHFHKQRKKDRLIELCKQYGYEYRIHGDKIRVKGRLPKRPGAFMFEWTELSIKDFVHELKYWDGTQGKTSVSVSSKHREDLEWYKTFGRLIGVGGNISKPYTSGFGSTIHRLQQNNRLWASGSSVRHTKIAVENLSVYCPTVETGWFYVRRNGKIFVTGNTNYYGTPPTMAMHLKVPKPLIVDFQHSYFSAFPVIGQANHGLDLPNWHNLVRKNLLNTNTITTLLGRRRRFFGRPSDDETIRAAIAYEPQSLTADEIDTGLLRLFRSNRVQLLAQVHDSILFQFPEEREDEIVPWATSLLKVIIPLAKGREFFVPVEAKTGWNWGDADDKNPQGLRKFKGHDDRKREVIRKVTPILGL